MGNFYYVKVAVRLVRMFWLLPQSSHFARAMEVAVKGKSPSYLHLFPHSSAGDRGGFSKPGGKLTSITLVSPFKDLNFFEQICLEYWCDILCGRQNLFIQTHLKILEIIFFSHCLRPFSLGYCIVQSLLMVWHLSFQKVNHKFQLECVLLLL